MPVIDLVAMQLACPFLNRYPLLSYSGGRFAADGWLPAPVYRMVSYGPLARGLFDIAGDEPIWAPEPLSTRIPYALLGGSSSWCIEVDPEFENDEWTQAPRRFRCTAVHMLCNGPAAIAGALEGQCRSGDATSACSYLQRSGDSPHGITLGIAAEGSGQVLVSGPVLTPILCSVEGSWVPLHLLNEPACGRDMEEQVKSMGALVVDPESVTVPVLGTMDTVALKSSALYGPVVRLPDRVTPSMWYHHVPYVPLDIDLQLQLLSACT
jgi:hypothetical protein